MAPDHDLFQTPPLTSLSVYFCSNLPGTLNHSDLWITPKTALRSALSRSAVAGREKVSPARVRRSWTR